MANYHSARLNNKLARTQPPEPPRWRAKRR
jgi:hypothetical protein